MKPNYILFDTPGRDLLLPFTHTRPVAACSIGILTIQEKWEHWLQTPVSHFTAAYLQEKYPLHSNKEGLNVLINGHVMPTKELVAAIQNLQPGQELYKNKSLVVKSVTGEDFFGAVAAADRLDFAGEIYRIDHPWDFIHLNDWAIREDFALLTAGRTSATVDPSNQVVNPSQIFIEEGASVTCSVLNATNGPIYIGKNALVMEGCLIRGGLGMKESAVMKMGTKIYGAVSLGKATIIGGEIKNAIFFDYANKAHDGYIGDAVIGEWCNLGAGTNCSNLKNNGKNVRIWMEAKGEAWDAGLKCGVLMGDYSRAGINTMFNTGTVVGVSCNLFGGGFPGKYLRSFTWGGSATTELYRLEEALRDAGSWMEFKKKTMQDSEKQILRYIFETQNSGNV
ncbi:UDP-N-acetylglucosamine diphosphorylase/glucosamine-1-phosphate N-acetyltransferase [Chitinophaga skermanii]|uniref:UDP-N-acetylglucosamine diphosphorylase/glucosamine-1-phosphate N-acetyltransferase n=1 Tax=Chitinophaga skermanii TaxID=331697 RepID=A0A327QEM6_9BACT|nr:putative sugar nucleotidyl transferase [Chitinophaga skermanii]RAJ02455.1 UDP-N-acetylglucosamine diphosphorylase/glucosamine-1-phosphate N-acetyltransferase [Chitinophaga skermanii]